jgi:sugar phosphate isomerase/epimerase
MEAEEEPDMGIPVALQMYTVRAEAALDFTGVLEKIARIGYRGVEFAGYGGLSAGELAGDLERLGILPAGTHVGLEALEKDLDGVIAYSAELGNPYIVCPYAPITDLAAVKKYAALFNRYGEKIQAAGLEFCYHNHSHEFALIDGRYALDLLLKETDPALVEIELDTCWVHAAGVNPIRYIEKYAGRCPLIHLKDLKAMGGKQTAEVGAGVVDVKGVVKESEKSAVEWLIVEQDSCERPPLESAEISLKNMKRMGML